MFKIKLEKLDSLYKIIAESYRLVAPQEKAGQVEFYPWSEGGQVRLDVLQTVKSAKEYFFPQSETLYHAKLTGKKLDIIPEAVEECPTVYFGVRGCDVKSFDILDKVFLSEPADTWYQAKREQSVIVAAACGNPENTCFCGLFGVDAALPGGDVTTWMDDSFLYWNPVTEKGDRLTETVKDLFEGNDDTAEAAVTALVGEIRKKLEALPLEGQLSLDGLDGDHLTELFESDKWTELSKACLGCGTCTFVCPTCQCYDIRDYDTGHGIQKFRCWDSCMYSDFTMMAHGNNRTTQLQRFRQRFMHKLVYFPSNNDGEYGCVGCGRCLKKCPVSLNIAKVIKTLGGEKHE